MAEVVDSTPQEGKQVTIEHAAGNPSTRRLIPRKVAMHRLCISHDKWNKLVNSKRLPVYRFGGRVFMRSDELEAILENPEIVNAQRRAG